MNKKTLGQHGEDLASIFLQKQGYKILEKNYRSRLGEIDIVAQDGQTICFVEVKSRSSLEKGNGLEAVTKSKQKKLTRLALTFLKHKKLLGYLSRFDVVSVRKNTDGNYQMDILKDAFEASGGYNY